MNLEAINIISRSLALVALYVLLGFGSGFILGILSANFIFGRREITFLQKHKEDIREAAKHNAQWQPDHERWRE